jgi:uncharacterized protein
MASKFSLLILICLNSICHPGFFAPWGKNNSLYHEKSTYIAPKKNNSYLPFILENCILFHQNVISPVDGPRSHFRPTSARYMLLALRRYGLLKGYSMGCDRLLRENKDPWVYRAIVINRKLYKFDPTF